MHLLASAQIEMSAIIAERRVQATLTRQITPAADLEYQIGDEALAFSEQEKNWVELSIVMHVQKRMITIENREGTYCQIFNALYSVKHAPSVLSLPRKRRFPPLPPKRPSQEHNSSPQQKERT